MTVGDNRQREVDGYHYRYDAWGNTIQRTTPDEEQYFDYDSDNRLIRAQVYRQHQQVSDSRYHYDPLGRRIRKAVTHHDPQTATAYTKSTDFLWQGLRLLSISPSPPPFTRVYCYEQNSYAPLARIDTAGDDLNSPQIYYFHADVTGTPKEVTIPQARLSGRLTTPRGPRSTSIAFTRSTNRCASKGSTQMTKRGSTILPSATTTPTREGLRPKTR